ncbi:MAG: Cna B-type domain-containing protein, partial [Methanosphaera sp.]|nr:Cna B-type domain-containing protein [Methanosphaera sp.]
MNKCAIFLFITVILIGLTVVSAEEIAQDTPDTTTVTTTQTSTQTQSLQTNTQQNIQKENSLKNIETTKQSEVTNISHKQEKSIHKTQKNIKSASPSEELSTIELSTKTKLENAFAQAKIEIDNAQSTYEKEQIPESVKKIVKQITDEAARAETIYNASQDETLLPVITNIRNHAGYADLLINPQKLTDPVLAEKYKTRPLDRKNGKYDLLTIVAQKLNNTQESVYINLTSDEFQNLYNDVGEIHHPGEYDRYGHVQLVNKTNFVQVTNEPENFELIPFPLARIYLEGFYNKGVYYTYTFASSANGTGWYHVDGSTLTKARYKNYTTNTIVYGNSGIVFWKMLKTNNPDMKYVLTDERYYPDIDGYPPDNMPKENNDDNGIYFVGYVIKTETGGIHIDGVIVEYRVPEQTYNVNFTARKVWNDSNNQDGLRTNTVTIQLLADGERYGDNIVLYEGNNWTYNYVNLPRYNKNHKEINYTINELNIPTGYKASINNYVVTNTHIPETKDIEVFKEWNDDNNRDGIRPKSITVDLYANNALKQTVVINNTNWRYTFRNLPVYNKGNKINYTVRERNVNRYTTNIRNINNEYIITNTYIPATRNITVNKNWNDNNNQDGIRPTSITVQLLKDETAYQNPIRLTRDNHWTYTFRNLPVNENGNPITYRIIETAIPEGYTVTNKGLTITNTHIPETKDIEVLKEWDDDHNRDGIRPSQVTVNLLADGEVINTVTLNTANSWRHEFENLDVYSNGRKINYTVQEIRVNNYTTTITEVNNEFIILNTHVPLVKEVNVIKVWDDHDDEHKLRPDSVQVQLFADGEKYGETTTLTSNGNWRHTFTNLPVNFDGKEIIYVVKEVILPEEYYNTINVTGNTVTITNIFDPEHAHVKVIKEWDDNHDSDKLRPTSVQVQLYANGEKQGNPVTLSQANYWRHSFDNLLKYVNDEEVNYTVQEVTPVTGYTSELKTLAKNEYAIVNKHNPETINITINKVWEDDNNLDGIRPNNIQIVILSDGEVYESRTLSERNGWKYTFTNLNKNFDGKEIVYTVAEIGLTPGYITTYDGFTITNKHTPETIEINVVKEWIANYNQDGIRPETIQVQLNKNGIATQNVTLSDNNNWTHIFKNLPKYENGEEISYTITETPVPQYTTTVTNENNKVIIRNVHIPETINITINKVWKDNNNQDGIRPDRIRVALLKNGEEIDRVTLSENNSWKYTFKDLDKNYNGKPIKYTIDEIGIPTGYKVQYNGYTITNIHTPETMDVIVIVEWDDLDDIDEIRPENVTITLYKNDEPIKNISISPDDDWRTIFEDLPIYENGTPINYTADEILPNG